MTITWKQIDVNGNDYVDGTEAVTAKAKGVKNVWKYMQKSDYENGVTREQKLKTISARNDNNKVSIQQTASFNISIITPEKFTKASEEMMFKQYIKENSILEINCYKELKQKELEVKENEFSKKFGFLDTLSSLIGLESSEYTKYKQEICTLKEEIKSLEEELEARKSYPLFYI